MCRPPMAVHLDSLLNSVTRSREPSHANSSLPRCETFGLSATVISTAFPRLALSPRTEGKNHGSLFGRWRQSVHTFYGTSNRKKDTDWKLTVSKILKVISAHFKNPSQCQMTSLRHQQKSKYWLCNTDTNSEYFGWYLWSQFVFIAVGQLHALDKRMAVVIGCKKMKQMFLFLNRYGYKVMQ